MNAGSSWFGNFPLTEFRKSLTRYREVDSPESLYAKYRLFSGKELPETMPCPESGEGACEFGRLLQEFELWDDAASWLEFASDEGIPEAKRLLGHLYMRGRGVPQSFTEAISLFESAMDGGSTDALYDCLAVYEGTYPIRAADRAQWEAFHNSTPEQRGVSPEKAVFIRGILHDMADHGDTKALLTLVDETDITRIVRAAEDGSADALCYLSNRYFQGKIPSETPFETGALYEQCSADLGNPHAQFSLAFRYAQGLGVDASFEKAFGYYLKSAQQGLTGAQVRVADAYLRGEGTERSYDKAREWYMAASGCADAQYRLGEMYRLGLGVERDYPLAREWLTAAASGGYADAEISLAIMDASGHGCEPDPDSAFDTILECSGESERADELFAYFPLVDYDEL